MLRLSTRCGREFPGSPGGSHWTSRSVKHEPKEGRKEEKDGGVLTEDPSGGFLL